MSRLVRRVLCRRSLRMLWAILAMMAALPLQSGTLNCHFAYGAAVTTTPATTASSRPGPATVREGSLRVQGQYPIEPHLVLWLPGSMDWPHLRSLPFASVSSQPCTFKTVELSNAYLTARFVPQVGFRLFDLTWNDDPLKRQAFYVAENLRVEHMYRWEGSGYLVSFGAMKWGFPFTGHTISDHAPWTVTQGVDGQGTAWVEGTYTDMLTGIVGTVRAELPADAAALRYTFTCRNPRSAAQGLDYWIDSYVPSDRHTEFALPATEVITHQGGWRLLRQMFCSWPIKGGDDHRFFKTWDGSQGAFPSDLSAGYSGFYNHTRGNGVVRIFPPDIAKGVKFWMSYPGTDDLGEMFGGLDITQDERRYLGAGQTITWQETWYPVRDLKGIDAANADVAIRVAADEDGARLYVTSTRALQQVALRVHGNPAQGNDSGTTTQQAREYLYETRVNLEPGRSVTINLPGLDKGKCGRLEVTVAAGGRELAFSQDAALLKADYADEKLAKDRQAYTATLKKAAGSPDAAPEPADGFLFRHVAQAGEPSGAALSVPNACCLLPDGSIAVADESRIKVYRADLAFDRYLKIDGLRWPTGLAVKDGMLCIADSGNSRIVCVDPRTEKVVRTISLASQPGGIAPWREGLAITLPRRGEVVYVDLAGDGLKPEQLAGPSDVRHPFGIVADGARLLVADPGNQRVIALSREGRLSEVASSRQGLSMPSRVAVSAGCVYVLDAAHSQILVIDPSGGAARVHLNGRLLGDVSLGLPSDLIALDGGMLVLAACPASLTRLDRDGHVTASHSHGSFSWPNSRPGFQSFCRLPDGGWLAADLLFNLFRFDKDAKLIGQYGAWGRNDGQLWEANAIACDSRGYVYIGDFFNFRILRFDPKCEQMRNLGMDAIATDGVPEPSRWYVRGLAIDGKDRLAVAVCGGQAINIYSPGPENRLLAVLKPYQRFHPMSVAYDSSGNLLVLDDAAAKVLIYPAKQLARLLEPGGGSEAASSDMKPTIWDMPPDKCALSIAPDGKGGCYISTVGTVTGTFRGQGEFLHLDESGKLSETLLLTGVTFPRQIQFDGDRLLIANSVGTPGLLAMPIDGTASRPTSATTVIPYPRQADVPGTFRSAVAVLGKEGEAKELIVIDSDRKIKATVDPVTMKLLREEPFDLHVSFYNPSPDGTVVLHDWNGQRYLWDRKTGQISKWSIGDIQNPRVTVHDSQGGWWITIAEPDRQRIAFFSSGQDKPAWTVPYGDNGQEIGPISGFAPLASGDAWASDRNHRRLVLLSRKDGSILKSTSPGVVNSPIWLWPLDDGSLLVSDRTWGILHVAADGSRSWRAVQDLPPGRMWQFEYDRHSGRLLYSVEQANSVIVGQATSIDPSENSVRP